MEDIEFQNAKSISYEDDNEKFKKKDFFSTKKEKELSFYQHDALATDILTFLTKRCGEDTEERKKKGYVNNKGNILSASFRSEIISFINSQLRTLQQDLKIELNRLHEKHLKTNKEEFILINNYFLDFFLMSQCVDDGIKPKIVFVLPSPTYSQLSSKEIDPNPKYPNYLSVIIEKFNSLNSEKEFRFVFAIPFYLGEDQKKSDILSSNSLTAPLLSYARDLILALDPDYLVGVGKISFEKILNKFQEKNSKDIIKRGGIQFNERLNESITSRYNIEMYKFKSIRIFYCPHPYIWKKKMESLKESQGPMAPQSTNVIVDLDLSHWKKFWDTLDSIFNPQILKGETFIDKDTKSQKKNAVSLLKEQTKEYFNPKPSKTSEFFEKYESKKKSKIEKQKRDKKKEKELIELKKSISNKPTKLDLFVKKTIIKKREE